jgi:hypothetical protein
VSATLTHLAKASNRRTTTPVTSVPEGLMPKCPSSRDSALSQGPLQALEIDPQETNPNPTYFTLQSRSASAVANITRNGPRLQLGTAVKQKPASQSQSSDQVDIYSTPGTRPFYPRAVAQIAAIRSTLVHADHIRGPNTPSQNGPARPPPTPRTRHHIAGITCERRFCSRRPLGKDLSQGSEYRARRLGIVHCIRQYRPHVVVVP